MILEVKIKPNSPEFRIERKNDQILIQCRSPPENNKANKEIIKELTKLTKRKVKILRGFTSKKKSVLINNITETELNKLIE